jgi:hypothetical protein
MTPSAFRRLALSFGGAHEEPHFARTSFRVGKRIFATMTRDGKEAMVPVLPVPRCLALLESDRDVYIDHGGWTRRMGGLGIRLAKADTTLVAKLMREAWERIAPKQGKTSSPAGKGSGGTTASRGSRGRPATARPR